MDENITLYVENGDADITLTNSTENVNLEFLEDTEFVQSDFSEGINVSFADSESISYNYNLTDHSDNTIAEATYLISKSQSEFGITDVAATNTMPSNYSSSEVNMTFNKSNLLEYSVKTTATTTKEHFTIIYSTTECKGKKYAVIWNNTQTDRVFIQMIAIDSQNKTVKNIYQCITGKVMNVPENAEKVQFRLVCASGYDVDTSGYVSILSGNLVEESMTNDDISSRDCIKELLTSGNTPFIPWYMYDRGSLKANDGLARVTSKTRIYTQKILYVENETELVFPYNYFLYVYFFDGYDSTIYNGNYISWSRSPVVIPANSYVTLVYRYTGDSIEVDSADKLREFANSISVRSNVYKSIDDLYDKRSYDMENVYPTVITNISSGYWEKGYVDETTKWTTSDVYAKTSKINEMVSVGDRVTISTTAPYFLWVTAFYETYSEETPAVKRIKIYPKYPTIVDSVPTDVVQEVEFYVEPNLNYWISIGRESGIRDGDIPSKVKIQISTPKCVSKKDFDDIKQYTTIKSDNLFYCDKIDATGLTCTKLEDGTFILNGTPAENKLIPITNQSKYTDLNFATGEYTAKVYTISGTRSAASAIRLYYKPEGTGTGIEWTRIDGGAKTVNVANSFPVYLYITGGKTFTNYRFGISIVKGNTIGDYYPPVYAHDYEARKALDNKVSSNDIKSIVSITKEEYNLIETPDDNTLYIISG